MNEPNPDLKRIIDETVNMVAKKGKGFEDRLVSDAYKTNNPKLSFLKSESIYRTYYEKKKEELRVKNSLVNSEEILNSLAYCKSTFSVDTPCDLTEYQDQLIKITAQYIATNGQELLNTIQRRESNNPKFNFLKPTSKYFMYFTDLIKAYLAVIVQKEELITKLKVYSEAKTMSSINQDSNIILMYNYTEYLKDKEVRSLKQKEEELKKETKEKSELIDWGMFTIVETVTLDDFVLDTKPIEDQIIKSKTDHPLPEGSIKIVRNYNREAVQVISRNEQMDVVPCPICNLKINEKDFDSHLKLELSDPKWKEAKDEINKRKEMKTLNSSSDMVSYLNEFAKGRPDIFGDLKSEPKIDVNLTDGPELTYSGFAPNINRTSANMAMLLMQNKRHLEENKKLEKIKENKPSEEEKQIGVYILLPEDKRIFLRILSNITGIELKNNIKRIENKSLYNEFELIIKDSNILIEDAVKIGDYNIKEGEVLVVKNK